MSEFCPNVYNMRPVIIILNRACNACVNTAVYMAIAVYVQIHNMYIHVCALIFQIQSS